MSVILNIGSSSKNIKYIKIDDSIKNVKCIQLIPTRHPDQFDLKIQNGFLVAKRIDHNKGWGAHHKCKLNRELMNTRMFQWKRGVPTGLGKHMDVILLSENCIIYNKPLANAKTIFVHTRLKDKMINHFIDHILSKLTKPVNVVIAGEDYTFPNNTDQRMKNITSDRVTEYKNLGRHNMINKLFVENLDAPIINAIPIPLGVNPKESPVDMEYFLQFANVQERNSLKITNFNRTRCGKGQWLERCVVDKLCEINWREYFVETGNINDHRKYLKTLSSYAFTLCVHGGGLDVNPKLFEALLVGVIPIIRENKPYTDIYKRLDLPVVIVKEWTQNTINKENLLKWYGQYHNYFQNETRRNAMLNFMTLDFWIEEVEHYHS